MKYILTQEKFIYNKKLEQPTNEIFGLFKKLFSMVSNAIKNVKGGEELNKAINDTKTQIDSVFIKQTQIKTNTKAQNNNQPVQPTTGGTASTQNANTSYNTSLEYKINEADTVPIDYSTLSIDELKELETIINQQLKNITDKFTILINQIKKKYEGNLKTSNAADLASSTIQEYIFDKKYDMFAKSSDKNKIAEIQKQRADAEKKVKDLTFKINSEGNATTNLIPKQGQEYNYLNSENKTIKVKIVSTDDSNKEAKVNGGETEFNVKYDKLLKIDGINYNEQDNSVNPEAGATASVVV
jgi:hypothetical protein